MTIDAAELTYSKYRVTSQTQYNKDRLHTVEGCSDWKVASSDLQATAKEWSDTLFLFG